MIIWLDELYAIPFRDEESFSSLAMFIRFGNIRNHNESLMYRLGSLLQRGKAPTATFSRMTASVTSAPTGPRAWTDIGRTRARVLPDSRVTSFFVAAFTLFNKTINHDTFDKFLYPVDYEL